MRRALLIIGVALVALAPGVAHAKPPAGTWVGARTDPAVQQVVTTNTADGVMPTPRLKPAFWKLFAKAKAKDGQSKLKWVLRTAAADVGRYVAPAKPYRTHRDLRFVNRCSGWWASPQGHLVTGAQCVSKLGKDLMMLLFSIDEGAKLVQKDVENLLKRTDKLAQPDQEVERLAFDLFAGFAVKHTKLTNLRHSIELATPAGNRALTLLKQGESWPGLDFALLKARNVRNAPSLPLGRDTDVRVGDVLYVNGFPSAAVELPEFDKASRFRPTLVEGLYTARRTTIKKVPYLQTQVPAYGGNTGSPVFSKEGTLVGMLVGNLGSILREGGETENANVVLPVSVIAKQLGFAPAASPTTTLYNAALDDFFADRYKLALPKFRRVLALYPAHPYVKGYIDQATKAVAAGRDKSGGHDA
ncbi:serine protease [Nonomuraea sp. NPDC050663]|uniref:serine protease n=1 Tax=Nonomuraea sp. NPDC050663 TaxID=3364370 RepID=UPI0037ACC348